MKKLLLFISLTISYCNLSGQQYLSSNHFSGTGSVEVDGFITDELQNTYISGPYTAPLIHNNQSVNSNGGVDSYIAKYNDDQQEEWFVTIGGDKTDQYCRLALAPDGHLLVVGVYGENCTMGTTTGAPVALEQPVSSTAQNIFVAKYNSQTGELLWVKTIMKGVTSVVSSSIAVDANANIIIGGRTIGAASIINGQESVPVAVNMGFVIKLSPDGTYQWDLTFLSSSSTSQTVLSSVSVTTNSIVFAGYTYKTMTFTDAKNTTYSTGPNLNDNGNQYFFIGSVNNDGSYIWLKNSTSSASTSAQTMANANDILYLTGVFGSSDLAYDNMPLNLTHPGGSTGIYLLQINSNNGERINAYSNGSSGSDVAYDLKVRNNLVYLCGSLGAQVVLPDKTIPAGMFVVAYSVNNDKTLTMIDVLEGVKADNARGIVFSPKSFKLTGAFSGTNRNPITIGDSIYYNSNTGSKDVYMAKACPIVGITPTVTNVSGCDVTAKNGSISLSVAGGADPYTYQWEKEGSGIIKDQTASIINGLDTGRYVATVLFNNQYCSKSANVTITAPQSLSITALEVTHDKCDDPAITGAIKVNTTPAVTPTMQFKAVGSIPNNPTPVYNVDWTANNGQFANCPPGQYQVWVRNGDGSCTTDKHTAIAALKTDATISATTVQYQCSLLNQADTIGQITATVSAERADQNVWFMLADAVTGATVQASTHGDGTISENGKECVFEKVVPGKYLVTTGVVGSTCMIESDEIDIANPPAITISSVKDADVLCAGTATGRISVTAKGGVLDGDGKSTLSYILNYADDTPTNVKPDPRPTAVYFDNLAAGLYNVIVKDQAGCTDSVRNVDLSDLNSPIEIMLDGDPHAACYGLNNGSVKLIASGGVHPDETTTYTYTLTSGSNSYQNASGNFFKNLPAASYTATVTEHTTKCKTPLNTPIVINSMQQVVFSDPTHENVLCKDGNSGTISIASITGGTEAYTASITRNDVPAGSKSEAPYTFDKLFAGTYMVSVADDYGCTAEAPKQVNITEPATILTVSSTTVTPATCPGTATGTITATGNGGTVTIENPDYMFELIEHGKVVAGPQASGVFNNVYANTYIVQITDANGCTALSGSVEVTQPASMQYEPIVGNVKCHDEATGSISLINITGGSAGTKSYYLTDVDGIHVTGTPVLTEPAPVLFDGLKAGTYKVRINVDGACGTLTEAFEITQPEALTLSAAQTKLVTCAPGNDGVITVTAGGGVGSYQYKTDATSYITSNTIPNLPVGDYIVTIKDGNNCELAANTAISVRKANNPDLTATGSNIKCFGGFGSITASATAETDLDGTAGSIKYYQLYMDGNPYSGEVKDPTFSDDELSAGNYAMHVKDNYGCETQESVVVAGPSAAIGLAVTSYSDAFGSTKGSITVQPSGGWLEYTITCYFPANSTNVVGVPQTGDNSKTYTFPNLEVGDYKIESVDTEGCLIHQLQTIKMATGELDLDAPSLKVFPNPSSDGRFIIEWDTKEDRKVTLEIFNMSGQLVYKTNVQTGIGGARTSLDISGQSRGTYLLRVPELNIKQKLVVQ